MATYMPYCIPLRRSVLVFFPKLPTPRVDNRDRESESYVVQVMIKQAYKDVLKEMTSFFLVQFEITKAIETILFAHICTALPEELRVEGNGYVLRGKRKPWDYGKTLNLAWGGKSIQPCADKWTFIFEVVPHPT